MNAIDQLQEPDEYTRISQRLRQYVTGMFNIAKAKIEEWDIGPIPSREEYP